MQNNSKKKYLHRIKSINFAQLIIFFCRFACAYELKKYCYAKSTTHYREQKHF